MWERFSVAGRAAWSIVGLAVALAIVAWLGWQLRVVFPPLVLAGAICFLLNPIVSGLHRRGIRRSFGTALTYIGFVAVLVALGFGLAPLVSDQADELSQEWPQLRADVEDWIDEVSQRSKDDGWIIEIPNVEELRDQLGGVTDAETQEFDRVVADAASELEANGSPVLAADLDRVAAGAKARIPADGGFTEQLATVREVGGRIFEVGLIFVLGPIIAFYLLVDLPQIGAAVRRLVPEGAAPQVMHVAHRLNLTIGGYFRGQLLVATIVGTMVSIGLAILGLPFWIIVGMIAGLFNMVPLIGPWVGAVPGVVIALTTADTGTAIWVVVVMAGAQQIDNHFISPLVMQRTTNLHPAVVMLALLAGGTLGGFFGLLLAVPITASLKVVVGHLWQVYVLQRPLDEVLAPDPPDPDDGILEPLDDYVHDRLGVPHAGVGSEAADLQPAEPQPAAPQPADSSSP